MAHFWNTQEISELIDILGARDARRWLILALSHTDVIPENLKRAFARIVKLSNELSRVDEALRVVAETDADGAALETRQAAILNELMLYSPEQPPEPDIPPEGGE